MSVCVCVSLADHAWYLSVLRGGGGRMLIILQMQSISFNLRYKFNQECIYGKYSGAD